MPHLTLTLKGDSKISPTRRGPNHPWRERKDMKTKRIISIIALGLIGFGPAGWAAGQGGGGGGSFGGGGHAGFGSTFSGGGHFSGGGGFHSAGRGANAGRPAYFYSRGMHFAG